MNYLQFFLLAIVLSFPNIVKAESLMLATTTSTQDSGLLDFLKPIFEKETGINLNWTSVGTGKALQLGKNCDVDVLLVHAPDMEIAYINAGYGLDRHEVMYNDFIIVGPRDDPAGILGQNISQALKIIANNEFVFVSRGDNSGTHIIEKKLWVKAEVTLPDRQEWYISVGQGMMATLNIGAEKKGYVLTDRGTWIKFDNVHKDNHLFKIIIEGDKALFNQYSILTVSPIMCPNTKVDLANAFTKWWISSEAQNIIAEFSLGGKQLFFPNAKDF